jgi:protein gp37
MATNSTIEWTETTWNPVVGCTKVSEGCRNCYAERMARRLASMAEGAISRGEDPGRKANYVRAIGRHGWSGRVVTNESALQDPLRWKQPRVVFVNSMSDVFHAEVPERFIRALFDVMVACPQHTFQVLTKRPERAAAMARALPWPKNVWMGTSVERADVRERVDLLRQVPAKVRFISAEPLIGPVGRMSLRGMHWVIVGGESGPGARPMNPEWVRDIRDRCVAAGVAFFFKQWGGVNKKRTGRVLDGKTWDELPQ